MPKRLERACSQFIGYTQFITSMCAQCIMRHQLSRDIGSQRYIKSSSNVYGCQFSACRNPGLAANSLRSRSRSARSVSDCELTETYSPAAIDIAPATRPAMPAIKMLFALASAAATPRIRLAVETIPSFAPRTAARSHPIRPILCLSICSIEFILFVMYLLMFGSQEWPGRAGAGCWESVLLLASGSDRSVRQRSRVMRKCAKLLLLTLRTKCARLVL